MSPTGAASVAAPPQPGRALRTRYSIVAIVLHWTIAVMVLGMIASGLWMADAIRDPARQNLAYETYQLHKAFGLSVLLLSLARLAWRLGHPAPPLPADTGRWQRLAAHAVHVALYGLTIGVPFLGWLMVSASPLGLPTVPFGLFEWPHLPVLGPQTDAAALEGWFKLGHRSLAYATAGLLVVHIGAALKHQFLDRDDLIARMMPGRGPRPARPLTAGNAATNEG